MDAERTRYLNEIGYTVLRFTNEEVLHDIDNVLEEISDALEEYKTNQAPLPSGGVGGGFRVGFGFDVHRLVEGRDLWLGGIKIPFEKGLLGHSDADVLIHAVSDALLGAAALRDIGYHFPDTSAETLNMDSKIILLKTVELLREKGYEVGNVDATICAEHPKLNPHIPQMQQTMAEVMDIPADCISIKATTTERLGFTGREEGIAAYAVALIAKC
ncbi:MAG: 2-C-methyl-D-erythritol 2,4-cyclodiphosphate synthase [Prevotella sp.]|nr:2-C-methyl-D-erythritol 2,4-cyclodiphosphate synthase [Prevotella sp.]